MSWGYQHKSPQIRQLNTPEISFLTVQKDIVRDQGVSRATLPPKERAFLVRQLLLVAVDPCVPRLVAGLCLPLASRGLLICMYFCMATPILTRIPVIYRAHPNPG